MKCQVCDSDHVRIKFKKNNFDILECIDCHYMFTAFDFPEEVVGTIYSDEYFFNGGVGYPNYLKEKDILIEYGKWYAELVAKYRSPGTVLDTGAAAGFILKGFVDSGWSGIGLEPNRSMAKYGREKFDLDITTGTLENFQIGTRVDLVNVIQVVGHFYDLKRTIEKIKLVLKPKGLLLIESWNAESGYARVMGKNWHEYSPPSVLRWFSDRTLTLLFERNGFHLLAKGHPPKKINLSHGLALLKEKSLNFPFKKQVFNRLEKVVGKRTIAYPFRDVKWYLFQLAETVNKQLSWVIFFLIPDLVAAF